jgi:hypothetical protein
MQYAPAAVQLLEYVYNSPLRSPELTAMAQLLWPGFLEAVNADKPQQQQQQQQQVRQLKEHHAQHSSDSKLQHKQLTPQKSPEAFYKQLLQVAVLRGHSGIVDKLSELPTASCLTSVELEPLLRQAVQQYSIPQESYEEAKAQRAAADRMLYHLLYLPGARLLTPSALLALMHAALDLQDREAAEDAFKRLAGSASAAHQLSTEQLLAVAALVLQEGCSCFSDLLRLRPAAELSSKQVMQLLHTIVCEHVYAANPKPDETCKHQQISYAAQAVAVAPVGTRVDVAAATALLMSTAQLGQARLLATLCEHLPAAQLLTPGAIELLLLMCAMQQQMDDWCWGYGRREAAEMLLGLPEVQYLQGGQVLRLLAAAVQLGDDEMLEQLLSRFQVWAPEVDNAALLQLAIELDRDKVLQVSYVTSSVT